MHGRYYKRGKIEHNGEIKILFCIFFGPTDPDIVYVAAQGHLWGYSGERGLFKTADGGKSWEKLIHGLPDDGQTGNLPG